MPRLSGKTVSAIFRIGAGQGRADRWVLAFVACGFWLSACESVPTPYQALGDPSNSIAGGYIDELVSSNMYRIRFEGNATTTLEQVEEYWHRRASELCGPAEYEAEMYSDIDERISYYIYSAGVVAPVTERTTYATGYAKCL